MTTTLESLLEAGLDDSGTGITVDATELSLTSAQVAAIVTDETGTGALYFQSGDAGTPSALVGTNISGTAASLTSGITNALKSATTTVDVSAAAAPTTGQVLKATSGTTATWQTIAGGGDALVANPLSQFAATTSAQLAGVISDETGSGALVFAESPTLVGEVQVTYTADGNDQDALEIVANAAGFGDVKAIDVAYTTGAIALGADEAVMLLDIDQTSATGGSVYGLEVITTDGSASVYGMKAGAVVNPILQDSGTFANPTTGTNDTASTDVPAMIDGSTGTNTTIFVADDDYIIIGAAAAFTEIEFILQTPASNPGIQPTFGYSTAGAGTFTAFSPVDGTNGFRNSGVVAWDATDLTSHGINSDTGTYDIKITRTHASVGNVSLYYAKTAATVIYSWNNAGAITAASFAGAGTGLTGTAASLTAGNATLAATVTTNANLTGPVTSVGNATSTTATNDTNVGFGYLVNGAITSGTSNTGIGYRAIDALAGGSGNTAAGAGALGAQAANNYATAVGYNALAANTAAESTAVGAFALDANTSGLRNTALGYNTLSSVVAVNDSTAVGHFALRNASAGLNTAVGSQASSNNLAGTRNTVVGASALATNEGGSDSTAVGYEAGALATGGNNTFIGAYAGDATTTGTDNIVIGYNQDTSAAGASNEINIGGVFKGNTSTLAANLTGTLGVVGTVTAATFVGALTGTASGNLVSGGALGTPSSVTLTNATGLPTAGIVDAAVTLAKMANLAQDQFIGRTTASTGVPETATITAAARTVLDDTTVAAMVDTLGGATSTGTGGIARATSPTFVTPALGTPASGNAVNLTGTAIQQTLGSSDTITASVVSTTETAFASTVTIDADKLIAGVMYELVVQGRITTSASAPTLNVKLRKDNTSGTTFYTAGAIAPANSTTTQPFIWCFRIQGTAASGASVNVWTAPEGGERFNIWNIGTPATTQPVAWATSSSNLLVCTVTWSANTAGNSITCDAMYLRRWIT